MKKDYEQLGLFENFVEDEPIKETKMVKEVKNEEL